MIYFLLNSEKRKKNEGMCEKSRQPLNLTNCVIKVSSRFKWFIMVLIKWINVTNALFCFSSLIRVKQYIVQLNDNCIRCFYFASVDCT